MQRRISQGSSGIGALAVPGFKVGKTESLLMDWAKCVPTGGNCSVVPWRRSM